MNNFTRMALKHIHICTDTYSALSRENMESPETIFAFYQQNRRSLRLQVYALDLMMGWVIGCLLFAWGLKFWCSGVPGMIA